MAFYLMSLRQKVWKWVQYGYKLPSSPSTDQDGRKNYIKNAKVLNSITSGIPDSEFTKVMSYEYTKEMWEKLIAIYDGD